MTVFKYLFALLKACWQGQSAWFKSIVGFMIAVFLLSFTPYFEGAALFFANSLVWVLKAFILLSLLAVVLLMMLLSQRRWFSVPLQVKKFVALKKRLQSLEQDAMPTEKSLKVLKDIWYVVASDWDFRVHHPNFEFEAELRLDNYQDQVLKLSRVIAVYHETLSDEYYRLRYIKQDYQIKTHRF